jgi:Acetyltransferase (GNAT) domain
MADIALRLIEDGDLDALFEQSRDPEGVWMAAFTPENPEDRNAFDAHMARVRNAPDITMRAVICDGHLAGSIASFPAEGHAEVTYWIDRAAWGQGIATPGSCAAPGTGHRPAGIRPCRQRQRRLTPRPAEVRLPAHGDREVVRRGTERGDRGNHSPAGRLTAHPALFV